MSLPRIACLSSETAELCFALGVGDQVVGRSGFCSRPESVKAVPIVSTFVDVQLDRLAEVKPDIVLAFSDLQSNLCAEVIKAGYPVFTLNQRSLAQTFQSVRWVGGLLGLPSKAESLINEMQRRIDAVQVAAASLPEKPKVYFEEWDDPIIAGIGWVGELIEIAGGTDIMADLRQRQSAKERIIQSDTIIARAPDIMLASWCGKAFKAKAVRARKGWEKVPAVEHDELHELPGEEVLSPGIALVDGLERMHGIFDNWARRE